MQSHKNYTVENAPTYGAIDKNKAIHRALEQALKDKRPITVFEDGRPIETVGKEIYTVENNSYVCVESLRAINRAKEVALATKSKIKIFLNGNPLYLIDKKGTLVAA